MFHSKYQQIWKTQHWPQDWKKSVFIPIPKKANAKKCSNYCIIVLISYVSKVMLKILQARLQEYVKWELPYVQVGFRKGRGTRDQIANICWIIDKATEFQKKIYFCFIDYAKALCGSQQTGKFLKRWEYQTTLPASWKTSMWVKKQQLELDMEQRTASKLREEYDKAVYCHPAYLSSMQSCCSVAQLCLTLGPHELQHTRIPCSSPSPGVCSNLCHWVSDAIQPSHHLSSPSPHLSSPSPHAFNLSHWVFSNGSALCIRWPNYWSVSFIINPSNEYSRLISFGIDWHYAEYIIWNARLDESQALIKIWGNINSLTYADDDTLMAASEELKNLLMRVKEESEKAGLKISIKNLRSWHLVPLLDGTKKGKKWKQWQILFSWTPKALMMVTAAMNLKDACSLEGNVWHT